MGPRVPGAVLGTLVSPVAEWDLAGEGRPRSERSDRELLWVSCRTEMLGPSRRASSGAGWELPETVQ